MANDFHVMRFHNLLGNVPYNVNLVIPPEDLSGFEMPPEQDGNGVYQLAVIQPTDDARHTALGRFMDAWSKLELQLAGMLGRVLGMGFNPVPALTNSLGTRGQMDVIRALGFQGLTEEQSATLERLLERIKDNNTKRNYLVHGWWMLEWLIVDRNGRPILKPMIYRAYHPTDPATFKKLEKLENKKERKRFLFSVPRINALSRSIEQLMDEMGEFTRSAIQNAPNAPKQVEDGAV